MAPREQLQSKLETIMGNTNVYFQPPENVQMAYPAIVYERDRAYAEHADNIPWCITKQYQLTYISRTPDDPAFDALAALPMCTHERFFAADDLNHDVFNIYF
jgi:hypothetical protein